MKSFISHSKFVLLACALSCLFSSCISGKLERAQITQAILDARMVKTSCDMYAMKNDGKFPTSLSDLGDEAPTEDNWIYTPGLNNRSPGDTLILKSKSPIHGKTIYVRVNGSSVAE